MRMCWSGMSAERVLRAKHPALEGQETILGLIVPSAACGQAAVSSQMYVLKGGPLENCSSGIVTAYWNSAKPGMAMTVFPVLRHTCLLLKSCNHMVTAVLHYFMYSCPHFLALLNNSIL